MVTEYMHLERSDVKRKKHANSYYTVGPITYIITHVETNLAQFTYSNFKDDLSYCLAELIHCKWKFEV